MGSYNGAVWHYAFHIRIIIEICKHVIEDTSVTPTSIPFVDTIPLAILDWQHPPLGTCTQNPESGFDKATAFRFIANVNAWMFLQEWQEFLPLVISYRYS